MWVTTYFILFAYICTCESQQIWYYLHLFARMSHNIFHLICTYLHMWVTTYFILFAHICTCELQHIWSCKKCKKPWISVHWKFQERRMGHGKSRPLRNLSKKKGFRLFRILFGPVSRMIFTTISSKVENACLGVFAGKACVWWVYALVLHPQDLIFQGICIQCNCFMDLIFIFQVSVVFAILGLLAGVAIYMDPEVGILHLLEQMQLE